MECKNKSVKFIYIYNVTRETNENESTMVQTLCYASNDSKRKFIAI